MPVIDKQHARPSANHVRSAAKGSGRLLDEAVDVGDVIEECCKFLIYGVNRVGKSWLACTFPKPLLLLDFEPARSNGATSVKRFKDVKYLKVTSTKKALGLAQELKEGGGFATVVIDSATSLQDVVLSELLDLPAVPDMLSWGLVSEDKYRQRSEKTREVLRPFLDLSCHTVVIAKERDHSPKKDRSESKAKPNFWEKTYLAADLGGATAGWLQDACGYVCRLFADKETQEVVRTIKGTSGKVIEKREQVETGKMIRRLRIVYHDNCAAGFRSERGDDLPEHIDRPTWDKIERVIKGEKVD